MIMGARSLAMLPQSPVRTSTYSPAKNTISLFAEETAGTQEERLRLLQTKELGAMLALE